MAVRPSPKMLAFMKSAKPFEIPVMVAFLRAIERGMIDKGQLTAEFYTSNGLPLPPELQP